MKNKYFPITQLIRHLIQLAAFILFPGLFITILSSLGDIVSALVQGSFSFTALSAQLITVAAVFLITALWGRFFCGYLCAFGTLQELDAFLSRKLLPRKRQLPEQLDHTLKFLKYLVLAFIIIAIWMLALPVDSSFSPWGVFGMLVSGNLSVMSTAIPTVGFVLLVVIFVGAFLIERFLCRYLCPLGALFMVTSGKRLYKIKCNGTTCTSCGLCNKKCSMGINVPEKGAVSSGECIDCMQCLNVCPNESLSANPTPAVAGAVSALALCGLITVGNLTVSAATFTTNYVSEESGEGAYQDGVYTGSGQGFRGTTRVQVTVENGYISDITVLSYQDDREFFNKAQSSVISAILTSQSTDVSSVSGATYSGDSIIKAVADALGTEIKSSTTEGTDSGQDNSGQAESTPEASTGDSSTALDLTTVADGIYQGSGTGFRGITSVFVTVKDKKITDITVESYTDDAQYFSRAKSGVISTILSAQSLDVQTVSGATFSSNSIIEATADALGVSFENPNQSMSGGHGHGGVRH